MVMLRKMHTSLSLLLFTLATTTTIADVPRPRGVSLESASLYAPRADDTWVCLDGLKTIRSRQINDDYCDCYDGSDEPGTSACSMGRYHCANVGHRFENILSSRVNDGICDCCDGSDEYSSGVECPNTCKELGRAELEKRRTIAELHKRGATKRAEMITQGKKLRAERAVRKAELDRQRSEQEAVKVEKETLKRNAEAVESEALEFYKEQQREQEEAAAAAAKIEQEPFANKVEAEASFLRYDVNKDGFVEITELQVDMTLDRDRNGVVTVEEAKYILDARDRIDFDAFMTLSWPRIKSLQMLAQGLFKPPIEGSGADLPEKEDAQIDGVESSSNDGEEGEEDIENSEGYEDEDDADVGVGSVVEETTPAPEYDPETQRLIDLANEARSVHAEIERHLREIEQEIKEIDDQNAKDYGPNDEYAAMDGECYTFEDREYTYSLCPFERASQKQRSGGSETTLGRWDQWISEGDNKYAKQKYSHGASCWNGPQRSAIVQLKCALEPRITAVSEPNRCEYFFEFETPAACDGAFSTEDEESLHDEL